MYFLRSKDETFDLFCEWKELVENQQNKKVKCLRTDNGLEFCNLKFDAYCKEHGIERHKICTYTPQHNGVAKRMNRTIMEKVRCMLNESGLGEEFWAEAAATAAYLINRSPASTIDHNVPEELWLNKKPGYKHLRRFGSIAYVHIDQGKLKPRALKGIFIGYPSGTKGYKIWLLEEQKCVISRNVLFHEESVYKDTIEKERVVESEAEPACHSKSTLIKMKTPGNLNSGGVIQVSDEEESDESVDEEQEPEPQVELPETQTTSSLANYQLARDRERRQIHPPARFTEESGVAFALVTIETLSMEEPQSYQEATSDKEWKKWKLATHEEMDSLIKNGTWVLVDKPKDRKIIGCRWLFKMKSGIPGVEPVRYKARLVAKGYTQREGVDYQEIFAPVAKHTSIRYMRGSQDLNLVFTKEKEFRVTRYCDSDYAADLDRRRSVSGYVFTVGGNTVSWKANLQSVTALSTTEAEFMALTEAAKEALWIKGLMKDLGLEHDKVTLWCDSQSAICLSKNSNHHERTKHIDVRYNFICCGSRRCGCT